MTNSPARKNGSALAASPRGHHHRTMSEVKKMQRDCASPPPVPPLDEGKVRDAELNGKNGDGGGAVGAAAAASATAATATASPMKLFHPGDFSRRGTLNASDGSGFSSKDAMNGSRDADGASSRWSNSAHGSHDTTGDSSASGSEPTTASDDSRFSSRSLSAWDLHLRAMRAQGQAGAAAWTANLNKEEAVLLDTMRKHFSMRGGLSDWDAGVKKGGEDEEQNEAGNRRFSTRSLSGWDRQLPLNMLAQEVLVNRFSVRPDADWDAALGKTTKTAAVQHQRRTAAGADKIDDGAMRAHFSVRRPEEWDAGVLAAYAHRLSSRPLEDWDAQVFQKLLFSRYSVRPDDGWDARIAAAGAAPSSSSSNRDGTQKTVRRSRSSTMFSNRRLSAWDAGLVQKIPDISAGRKGGDDDSGVDAAAVRRSRSGSLFSKRDWAEWDAALGECAAFDDDADDDANRTPTEDGPSKRQRAFSARLYKASRGGSGGSSRNRPIFSVRDLDGWDAGIAAHFKEAIQQVKTPTGDGGDGSLGLYQIGA